MTTPVRVSKLLKRNDLVGLKCAVKLPQLLNGTRENPYPLTAQGIVRFMFWLQKKKDWRPKGPFSSHVKLCEQLTEEMPLEEIEKRMTWAAATAKHPWGINYLRRYDDSNNSTQFRTQQGTRESTQPSAKRLFT